MRPEEDAAGCRVYEGRERSRFAGILACVGRQFHTHARNGRWLSTPTGHEGDRPRGLGAIHGRPHLRCRSAGGLLLPTTRLNSVWPGRVLNFSCLRGTGQEGFGQPQPAPAHFWVRVERNGCQGTVTVNLFGWPYAFNANGDKIPADRDSATFRLNPAPAASAQEVTIVRVEAILGGLRAEQRFKVVLSKSPPHAVAPSDAAKPPVDLMSRIDIKKHTVSGEWKTAGTTLATSTATGESVIILPWRANSEYDLRVSVTCREGLGMIGVVFPVGSHACDLVLGHRSPQGDSERISGLERIDNHDILSSVATRRGVPLTNGRQYTVSLKVRPGARQTTIDVSIDDLPLVHWQGQETSLAVQMGFRMPEPQCFKLVARDRLVVFQAVQLSQVSGEVQCTEKRVVAGCTSITPMPTRQKPPRSPTKKTRTVNAAKRVPTVADPNALPDPNALRRLQPERGRPV